MDTAKESSSSKYVIGAIIGGVIGGLVLITAYIAVYCWGVCVDESHFKGEYSIRHRDIRVSTKMSFKVITRCPRSLHLIEHFFFYCLHCQQVLQAFSELCQFLSMKLNARHIYTVKKTFKTLNHSCLYKVLCKYTNLDYVYFFVSNF